MCYLSAEGAAGENVAEREREANKVDEEPASSSGDEETSTETRQGPKHIDESDPERAPYHRYSSQQHLDTAPTPSCTLYLSSLGMP